MVLPQPLCSLACWPGLCSSASLLGRALGSRSQVHSVFMSYVPLPVSLVPLVFEKDIIVSVFSRLSNFWDYKAPGRSPSAARLLGTRPHLWCWVTRPGPQSCRPHFTLQALRKPWILMEFRDREMEQLGHGDWNPK